MNRRLTEMIAQLKTVWDAMPGGRRLLIVGAAGVVFLGLALLTFTLGSGNQQEVLFSRLHAADAAEVLQQLEEAGIPYTLQQDLAGRAVISVPRDLVYRTRIELAAQGIPRQGSVGFEIFDETQLGMTDDVRRINLRRALNGELERTIRAMDVVDDARVQVAIPESRLFVSQQEKPTAAVMLTLRPGLRLARRTSTGDPTLGRFDDRRSGSPGCLRCRQQGQSAFRPTQPVGERQRSEYGREANPHPASAG